jgi:hypothetical protein
VSEVDGRTNVEHSINTAVVQSKASAQGGELLRCQASTADGRTYACNLLPTLGAYSTGMIIHWIPSADAAGGSTTLNVDGLGAAAVKRADGVSDPAASDIVAGRMYPLWYDGLAFRIVMPTPGAPRAAFDAVLCAATGSSNAYSCSLAPALAQYAAGLIINWNPVASGNGGPTTLNINGLGAKPVKQADGTSDPRSSDVVAGRLQPLWYDGAVFRMVQPPAATAELERTAQLKTEAQSGQTLLCNATGAAGAYTCPMTPPLTAYTTGMIVNWKPGTGSSAGPATLNIDALGPRPLKQADGATDPSEIVAGQLVPVWYDGAVFRIVQTPPAAAELDPAAQTETEAQSGRTLLCDASGAGGAYTCAMTPTLTAYTTGMVVNWRPAISSAGPYTLNIDGLGAKAIKQSDGTTDASAIAAGQLVPVWYDGAIFRLMQASAAPPQQLVGTWSSLPACDTSLSGRTYVFTDTAYETAYCNGTAWTYLANGTQLTPPVPSAFTWVNQSTATTSAVAGGMQLIGAASTGHSLNMLVKAAPSAPFTLSALIQNRQLKHNYPACGIVVRNSASGLTDFMKEFGNTTGVMSVAIERYTSPTAAPTTPVPSDPNPATFGRIWVRIVDNGSSRTTSISDDGAYWQQIVTHSGASYFAADQIGIGCSSWTSNKRPQMALWSWKEE